MSIPNWQLKTPIAAVIFDCDGTLSSIEGIDELANKNQVGEVVQAFTAEAMGKTGINPELYEKRLQLVQPSKEDVIALTQTYYDHVSQDVCAVIQLLQGLQKKVCIVSAGVNPAVTLFGERLNIASDDIFAVDLMFDQQGKYKDYDRHSPMTNSAGKREVVLAIKRHQSQILYVGDGLNDLSVLDVVTRFVGYGGSFYRENIASQCDFYIKTLSMAGILPLALTVDEVGRLNEQERALYLKGLNDIEQQRVLIPGVL